MTDLGDLDTIFKYWKLDLQANISGSIVSDNDPVVKYQAINVAYYSFSETW